MILLEHLPERTHTGAGRFLLRELAHGHFSQIALNGSCDELLAGPVLCHSTQAVDSE
jgi:hypothetical protein